MDRHLRRTTHHIIWSVALLILSAQLGAPVPVQALSAPAASASLIEPLGSFGGSIATVAVQGNFAYIVQGAQFVVLDITNPAEISQHGAVPLPGLVPADRVQVAGTMAYLIGAGNGLTIIDVSNPRAPRIRGSYSESSPIEPTRIPQDIVIHNNLAYLAMEGTGLRILDVSDPDHPFARNPVDPRYNDRAVEVVGTRAYLLTSNALFIYDVTDPAQPVLLSSAAFSNAVDLEVDGTYAYISSAQLGVPGQQPIPGRVWLDVVDVHDEKHLTLLSHLEMETLNGYTSLHIANGWAFLGVDDHTALIDISVPTSPVLRATFPVPFGRSVIIDQRAYLADSAILRILDLRNPEPPLQIGVYTSLSDFTCVRAVGDIVYVVQHGQALLIFDVHNPTQPRLIRREDDARFIGLCSAKIDGGRAYTDHLLFDISDPVNPTLLEFSLGQDTYYDMVASGTRLYAVSGNGLSIFDISNPGMPQRLSTLPIARAYRVAIAGQTVYVSGLNLTVVDVSNPAVPYVRGISAPFPGPEMMVVVGQYVIVDGNGFFGVLDVQNPTRPRLAVSWSEAAPRLTRLADGMLYELNGSYLSLIDVREPARPQILPGWDFRFHFPDAIDVENNLIYVVEPAGGLQTYQLITDRLPPKLPAPPPPTDIFLPILIRT